MPRTILHVDLDAFFVAVEQARDPSLRGRPVVVGGLPGSRGVVSSCSYEARRYGLHSGMPISTARRLCPSAIFLPIDGDLVRQASQHFFKILSDYTPLVEPGGIDEAYLDLTGCEPIAGSGVAAADDIRRRVRTEVGITASVGIATSKLVAKVASESAKPDGVLAVQPGQEAAFLAPLSVRSLPMVGPRLEAVLHRIGLRTLGDVQSAPLPLLETYLGSAARILAERSLGIDDSPVLSERPPARSVSRECTFAEDIRNVTRLRAVLYAHAEAVGADLRRTGSRAGRVSLKLRFADFTTISRYTTLRQPTYADQLLYEAANGLLERVLTTDRRPVRLIGLGAESLIGPEVQLSLVDSRLGRLERLAIQIDSLRSRYGHTCIRTGPSLHESCA